MHQDNQPHENALPDLEIDVEALQRELEYELVETLTTSAYSRDTTHLGIGGSREEALGLDDPHGAECTGEGVPVPRADCQWGRCSLGILESPSDAPLHHRT